MSGEEKTITALLARLAPNGASAAELLVEIDRLLVEAPASARLLCLRGDSCLGRASSSNSRRVGRDNSRSNRVRACAR